VIAVVLAQSSTFEEEPSALEVWVEENSMLVGVIAMALLFAFGLAWTFAAAHRNARQKAMAPTAAKHGLEYSPSDPFGSTKIAFPLFRAGEGRMVENVMWRDDANGRPVRAFDYSYYNEYRDNQGNMRKTWQHFSCAMGRHNGLWPTIRIGRERALDKVVQRIGLPDIEMESEEFNRAFVIQCEDAKFATDLLVPQMMEFLLTTKALLEFETKGRWLLISTKRVGAQDMPGLVSLADEFLQRIPPLIWELYPKAPDDTDVIPEEGLGFAGAGGTGSLAGDGIFIPGHDVFVDEPDDRRPQVEYDLDGNPIEQTPPERPWS
jgi:hypothetical protein